MYIFFFTRETKHERPNTRDQTLPHLLTKQKMGRREEMMVFLARTTFRGSQEPAFSEAKVDAEKMIDSEIFKGWEEEAKKILWSLTPEEGLQGYLIWLEMRREEY